VFWIDWASATHYFRVLHLNWNPSLFLHKVGLHQHWPLSQGPQNDSYNYGHNPQFTLTVAPPPLAIASSHGSSSSSGSSSSASSSGSTSGGATVWVLLTRHIVAKEAEEDPDAHDARGGGSGRGLGTGGATAAGLATTAGLDGKDYLTCHVFENTAGRRVFAPGGGGSGGGGPLVQGVYSNNQHALVRFDVPPPPAPSATSPSKAFTLVVSQYCKVRAVDFTLQAWCTTRALNLAPTPPLPPHGLELRGVWDAGSAGGALGNPRFFTNPMWRVALAVPGRFHAELLAPKEL
jgi:hypothetical protein